MHCSQMGTLFVRGVRGVASPRGVVRPHLKARVSGVEFSGSSRCDRGLSMVTR